MVNRRRLPSLRRLRRSGYRYLVVRLGSRCDADDVLQETFVCLARTRKRLATIENLEAYVFATARNEAIRWLKRGPARDG